MFVHIFIKIYSAFLTFETFIGIAISIIDPFSPDFLGRWYFFIMFMPSTITLFSLGIARTILPDFPLSFPVITFTLSPFFNFIVLFIKNLNDLLRQRNDFLESFLCKLPWDRSEYASSL